MKERALDVIDVAVVGAGPAGLATAIEAARRGLSVRVLERQRDVPDKACGEGLMPRGVAALTRLGALAHLDGARSARFCGIRYVQENGVALEGRFHDGTGLGIRRLALIEALSEAARRAGARLERGRCARALAVEGDGVVLEAGGEPIRARALVAADGLHSPLRRQLGLEVEGRCVRRFGLRRHFRGVDPGDFVEVHWSGGVECYLTPVGRDHLGVALLFEREGDVPADFERLLSRFPRVVERLRGGRPDTSVRGAGPLSQRAARVAAGRVALAGDAAGYVDAITGEGLSLAFECAAALGASLAELCARADERALESYEEDHAKRFRRYALAAGSLVWLARHPRARRPAFALLSRAPRLFELGLRWLG